jgi:hypothetical protein
MFPRAFLQTWSHYSTEAENQSLKNIKEVHPHPGLLPSSEKEFPVKVHGN